MLETFPEKSETISGKNICESCGKEFPCGAEMKSCWCFEVEIEPENLAQLREDFKNCLCEDCLRKK